MQSNRLVHEKSPYLLQHAHNPVDWYPWGEDAFAKARREDKPIFLSIGYSTCHWCHVMRRESFENEDIAAILNRHFVCIKLDREERPDVDRVYMTYVQAATGGGGWPMSVWLTPDLKPFMGGTYFPPEDRLGRPGFAGILRRIAETWTRKPADIAVSAERATQQLQGLTALRPDPDVALERALLDRGFQQIQSAYDPVHGGFGDAPKFPRPAVLQFLMRHSARTGNREALDMALFTLRKMADGGMHDVIGGGFHRYSVDGEWHVPHFEKMLYDQAQLAESYLDAYQITGDDRYADAARGILAYVLRDMTAPAGAFYSAEDADSPLPGKPGHHAEGVFYVWEQREIEEILGAETAAIFDAHYGVKHGGNVTHDPYGEFAKKNIFIARQTVEQTAEKFTRSPEQVRARLKDACNRLLERRAHRPRPPLDDKVITAWNGLMISAFARAYQVLADERYLHAAEAALHFIHDTLYDNSTGALWRRYRAGDSAVLGFVDDYAYLIQGVLNVYEAAFDIRWLNWALVLQEKQNGLFWDATDGGYFSTTGQDDGVLLRIKDDYDGAEPSPNSVAAMNLLRLAHMTDHAAYHDMAARTLRLFAARLRQTPSAVPLLLDAFSFYLDTPKQIVIAGNRGAEDTRAMLRAVHARFIPDKVLLLADGGEGHAVLARHMPFLKTVEPIAGKATAFVCENYVCTLPTTDREEMMALIAVD